MKTERTSLGERTVSTRRAKWRVGPALALGLLVAAVALPAPSFALAIIQPGGVAGARGDRILVKPNPGADLTQLNAALGTRVLSTFAAIGGLQTLELAAGADAQSLIALYQQSGLVEYAEPDFIVEASLAPNDPRYLDGSLWGLHNTGIYGGVPGADIRAPEGWDTQSTASNIIVAVIDTGARFTHEDLAANMWVNPGESGRDALGLDKSTNGMDDDGDGFIDDVHGINAILGTGIPWDDHGHGTHVSGTIGAVGNNSVGVVGVAWNVQLMACKFLDATGHGSVSDAITRIDYARKKRANIINASWGDYLTAPFNGILPDLHNNPAKSQALHDAIASARDAGILFVAACGNDGTDNDAHPLYPASYTDLDNIIAVAATDRTDTRAWFSNYGATTVALGAPGAAIFSCWNGSDSDYRYLDGTSMAAPHVAGVCALVWSYSPANTYSQIRNRVLSNTDPLPSLAGKCVSGGRLNLQKALGSTPGVTANFTASPTSGTAPLTVQFTDRSSGNITSWRWNFGDGSPTSTVQNPAHTYAAAGTFTASLNVSGLNGSTSTASQNIQVAPATDVTANFTVSPSLGTALLTVQFTDSSIGNIAGWLWNFGDSTAASTERNPTHIYLTAGTFTASLTVTGVSGSTSSKSQTIQVNNPNGLLATSSTSPGGLTQSSPTLSPATALAASSPQGGSSSSATTRNGTPMSQVGFSLRGKANETYLIQATTDLATWTVIATKQASSDGAIQFTDSDADNFSQRFYRGLRVTATIASVRSDRILVKPRAGVDLSLLHLSLGVQVLNTFSAIGNLQICQVPVGTTADQLIPIYVQSGLVEYAEADFIVQALLAPNDFRYQDGSLWGLHNIGLLGGTPGADIHAPEAWDTQSTASNVVVAVIDTGVRYTHEDLAANIWVNPADGSHGTNAIAGTTDPNDDQGHGTHVSGTIGAVGNNSGGVVGVTWRVQLMACKFLDAQGNGSISDAISCIDFARSHGANIINASWGSTTFTSSALHDAVQSARDAGIIWVAAAGNSGADNDATPLYPASYEFDNIIAVAATTRTDDLANFSNYGATNVDLGAPGASIFSTGNLSDSDYSYVDGSSFSAAHVSGACAIVWAHFPTDDYHQVVNRILSGVDPLPSLAGKCVTGGRLNLFKALGAAPPPPNQPVITLSAFQPDAWEVGPTNGVIRFHRTGDTSQAIQVSWPFSGTASNGVDYQQLPTTSPFPAGLADADLTITPIDDNQVESDETMIVTLAPGPAYTVGSPNSATVIIHEDNDQPPSSLTADFTANPTSGNAPLTVQFTDKSTGTITAWDWNFGDGSAHSSVQNPSHTYNSAADFTVTLTITGSGGATSSKSALIHVTAPPPPTLTANFTANPTSGQAPLMVQFTDQSTGTITARDWNFGDGSAHSSVQNPSHTYNSVADFTVTLTITGSGGATSSKSVVIHVTAPPPPSANFTANPTSGQAPLTVQFTDQSTGTVTAWDWNFGDGSAHSSIQNPSHTYTSAGDFTVTLTVSCFGNPNSSKSMVIHVTAPPPPPSASFTANPTSGQAPLMVQFTDQSTGTVTAWNWNFGDGSAHSSVQNPSHTYTSAGDFTATLTVTGSGGATSSASVVIHVTAPPPKPILTVSVTVSVTSEQSTTPGVCTISRTGDLSSTLTAHYTLSGTAINGVDYQTLSGSVEFAAGASEATVLIVPIDDHVLLEATELVTLTLSADVAYDLGLVNSGVVTILD